MIVLETFHRPHGCDNITTINVQLGSKSLARAVVRHSSEGIEVEFTYWPGYDRFTTKADLHKVVFEYLTRRAT